MLVKKLSNLGFSSTLIYKTPRVYFCEKVIDPDISVCAEIHYGRQLFKRTAEVVHAGVAFRGIEKVVSSFEFELGRRRGYREPYRPTISFVCEFFDLRAGTAAEADFVDWLEGQCKAVESLASPLRIDLLAAIQANRPDPRYPESEGWWIFFRHLALKFMHHREGFVDLSFSLKDTLGDDARAVSRSEVFLEFLREKAAAL